MTSILYATDCSQNSVAALKMAHALSQKLNANLIVLHVFDVTTPVLSSLSITTAKKEQEAPEIHYKKATDFYNTHVGVAPNPEKVRIVVENNPLTAEAISTASTHFKASLLVMGTKGKSRLKNIVVGSTTQTMIEKSPCALLMVPPNANNYPLKKITYATDFEETDFTAINWLVQHLALPYKAVLHVLRVVNIKEENKGNAALPKFKEKLSQQVSYKRLFLTSVHSQDVIEALTAYPEQENMDLMVMLKREKPGFLSFLFQPDSVKKMCSKTTVPLLSLNKELLQ